MFTFIFKGKIFQAKTLDELSVMLKQAGFTEDVHQLYKEAMVQEDISLEDILEDENQMKEEYSKIEEENIQAVKESLEQEFKLQEEALIQFNLKNDPEKLN
jgi:hypothetical protein